MNWAANLFCPVLKVSDAISVIADLYPFVASPVRGLNLKFLVPQPPPRPMGAPRPAAACRLMSADSVLLVWLSARWLSINNVEKMSNYDAKHMTMYC